MAVSFKKISQWWHRSLQQHFVWWAALLVVAMVGSGWWWLWRPLYHDITPASQLQTLQAQLEQTRSRFAALQSAAQAWQAQPQLKPDDLELMLPSSADIPDLMVQLEAVANHAGVQLQGVAVADRASSAGTKAAGATLPGGVRPLQVTLNISNASYSKLKAFLGAVQTAWRLVAVNGISFGREGSLAVDLSSYYLPH